MESGYCTTMARVYAPSRAWETGRHRDRRLAVPLRIVAGDLDREVAAHATDELVEAHLHGLGEGEGHARNLRLQPFLQLGLKSRLREPRAPGAPGLEHNEYIGLVDAHGITSHVRASHPTHDRRNLGHRLHDPLDGSGHLHGVGEGDGRVPGWLDQDGPLVELGKELRAQPGNEEGGPREHEQAGSKGTPRPRKHPRQEAPIPAFESRSHHDRVA
jgi:hypothetical protein